MATNTYEVIVGALNSTIIKRTDANGIVSWVPVDPNNSDYQAYKADYDAQQAVSSTPTTPPTQGATP